MITTSDAKLLIVSLEGVETLESALRTLTGDEIVSVYSLLYHYRTWGSNELIKWWREISHAWWPQKFYEVPCIFLSLWKPVQNLMFCVKTVFAARQCTRTPSGWIYGYKLSRFAMKGGITMNYWTFCLLDSRDVDLTSDKEEIFLRSVQIGKVTSSEFSKIFSSNWITNTDGSVHFNATHFFDGSTIDPPIDVKYWKGSIYFVMKATTIKHKEAFDLKSLMHSSVDLLAFVKLNMSLCSLSNA